MHKFNLVSWIHMLPAGDWEGRSTSSAEYVLAAGNTKLPFSPERLVLQSEIVPEGADLAHWLQLSLQVISIKGKSREGEEHFQQVQPLMFPCFSKGEASNSTKKISFFWTWTSWSRLWSIWQRRRTDAFPVWSCSEARNVSQLILKLFLHNEQVTSELISNELSCVCSGSEEWGWDRPSDC